MIATALTVPADLFPLELLALFVIGVWAGTIQRAWQRRRRRGRTYNEQLRGELER